jgi:hypothetical protein
MLALYFIKKRSYVTLSEYIFKFSLLYDGFILISNCMLLCYEHDNF